MPLSERHNLIFLSPQGQAYAWDRREQPTADDERYRTLFFTLPGICRVSPPKTAEHMAALGFSLPIRRKENRIRIASQAPKSEILQVLTPWEIPRLIPRLPEPAGSVLRQLDQAARNRKIAFGIFGSAALQSVTGYPYLHPSSDLDVVISSAPKENILDFYRELNDISRHSSFSIDVELKLDATSYIKLHELMGGARTVLSKGTTSPRLLSSQAIWNTIAEKP